MFPYVFSRTKRIKNGSQKPTSDEKNYCGKLKHPLLNDLPWKMKSLDTVDSFSIGLA